jgi:dipeptidyl aminopeptidase/acylaminoacyl peptidase
MWYTGSIPHNLFSIPIQNMKNIDTYLKTKVPSAIAWSPNGKTLAYQVSGPQGSEIRFFSIERSSGWVGVDSISPFRLYKDLPDLRWTADHHLLYNAGCDIWSITAQEIPEPSQSIPCVSGELLGELFQLSPDLQWVSFVRDGDLWVLPVSGGSPQQVTSREGLLTEDGQFFSRLIQWPQWSPDSRKIAYLSPMSSGYKVRVITLEDGKRLNLAPAEDIWGFTIINWSPDSRKLAIARLSNDFCHKELGVYDLESGEEKQVWVDEDEQWVDHNIHPGYDVAWSPDSRCLAFLSNQNGWRHLYVTDLEKGSLEQISSGNFDCYWCGFSPDGSRLAYVSNESHLQERGLWVSALDGRPAWRVTRLPGVCLGGWYLRQANFAWSPDGKSIAHVFSGADEMPGLWISDASGQSDPVRVYCSMAEGMSSQDVMHLEPVKFKSADTETVYGVLASAPGLNRAEKHPAIVFAYGAWDQEAQLGWEFGPKNVMFNYFVIQGYVLLLVDPRGSEGYGREHAHRQYHEGGRKQVDDVAAGAKYLSELGFVDPKRIAVFGYSYGGYMVLQTMVYAPDVFAAGVAMAPVSEWAASGGYSAYTNLRFGSPDEVPNPLYERSPLYQAYKIKGALLILHGTRDFNVPIISSEVMVNALMRTGKKFEYMVYPGEGHVWVQPETIRDCLLRVERFLNSYMVSQEEK